MILKMKKYLPVLVVAVLIFGIGHGGFVYADDSLVQSASKPEAAAQQDSVAKNQFIDNFIQAAFRDEYWIAKLMKPKPPTEGEQHLNLSFKFDPSDPKHQEIMQENEFPPLKRVTKWPKGKTIRIIINHEAATKDSWTFGQRVFKEEIDKLRPALKDSTGFDVELVETTPYFFSNDYKILFEKADVVINMDDYTRALDDRQNSSGPLIIENVLVIKFTLDSWSGLEQGFSLLNKSGEIIKSVCKIRSIGRYVTQATDGCIIQSLGLFVLNNSPYSHLLKTLYSDKIHPGMTPEEVRSALSDKDQRGRSKLKF